MLPISRRARNDPKGHRLMHFGASSVKIPLEAEADEIGDALSAQLAREV